MGLGFATPSLANGAQNKLLPSDRAVHEWYRFVLSFPPHLVRDYLNRFEIRRKHSVLDPFCGTGTTIVECKKLAIPCVGIEAHPMPCFASRVKSDWTPDPDGLIDHASRIAERTLRRLRLEEISDEIPSPKPQVGNRRLCSLPADQMRLLLKESISPLPLHKTLVLVDEMEKQRVEAFYNHERLALAKALVQCISNLHFGPEVGIGVPKQDVLVTPSWLNCVCAMADDLRQLHGRACSPSRVSGGDSREASSLPCRNSVDCVITSPPYPNEKDYTRTTRLESVVLGFIQDKKDLRSLKQGLIRSNTRNVFVNDTDDRWARAYPIVQRIAEQIEKRRRELGKTSGFERLYHKVTKLYFGGMARHFEALRQTLRPGAYLAYVVGDQASYLRVMIRTGEILAEIAESLGYRVMSIDLFRTRIATATREQLREEVVVLQWPG